jgi:hypothetical protein
MTEAVDDLLRLAQNTAILDRLVGELGMSKGMDNIQAIDEVSHAQRAADFAMRTAALVAPLPRRERLAAIAGMKQAVASCRSDFLAAGSSLAHHRQFEAMFRRMLSGCLDANRSGVPLKITFETAVDGQAREVEIATYRPEAVFS